LLDSLAAAEHFLDDGACLAHQGDGLLRHDLAPLVDEVSCGDCDAVLLVQSIGNRVPGPTLLEDERLMRLFAGPRRQAAGVALTGVHLFGPRFLREAGRAPAARNGAPGIGDAVEQLLRAGGRARTTEVEGWRPIRDTEDLLDANRLVLDELEPGPPGAHLEESRVQGRVSIHPSAWLESTVVRGPTIIGAGALLRDAYVGPYTAIGDGVRVDGAEIEHSIILDGAVIEHVGGRLEASVVGRGARVSRDFALPRAFRLRVGDGNEVSLA
jgi:glucose-1-phosphate thymidylyltransferase